MTGAARNRRRYDTSIDRAGLALGVGSLLGGLLIFGLIVAGGQRDPIALAIGFVLGTIFSAIAITAVCGPLWLVMHVAGLRGARHAALVAGVTAMGLFSGAQLHGFGAFSLHPLDQHTRVLRWASAGATSLLIALIAAAIGLAMWRIAYRSRD
ncbi:hypothetical protein ACX40Y_01675 [Sphingomonas sp. RS6]